MKTTALVLTGMFSVAAAATCVQAQASEPAVRLGAPDTPHCSSLLSVQLDGNMRRGDTDANGDYKGIELTHRCDGGLTYSANIILDTPSTVQTRGAGAPANHQFDTAAATLTVGKEFYAPGSRSGYAVYGMGGMLNGWTLGTMHGLVQWEHQRVEGIGIPRGSPASTPGHAAFGAMARGDYFIPAGTFFDDRLKPGVDFTAYGVAGNLNVSAGVQGTLSISTSDMMFRPSVPGMPSMSNFDAGNRNVLTAYAGFRAEATAYNVATARLGTQPLQTTVVLGAQAQLFNRVTVGLEYEKAMLCDVSSCSRYGRNGVLQSNTPVEMYKIRLGVDF